ncbi:MULTISPECIES: PTS mannitol transporter subunit IICB [unclassified Gemella]|uniref:PTS mannitol transporter subunit IICB n=1 Tax=unclassified Gemella TaxID=2624949 RepID=UPI001073DA0F|nr:MULTISPECIES: PTS mannitol transporter subunit IICB [unclassified Gemella]MBF0709960.1 PTS mannitol transporter subunit IICB [Gemella sp. GL1.1]MBF0747331.1 PTS mannitol transporter subunit IICB [Gemella sp. 19428wG2_WT2a]NYS27304.1 PTS mannitol transporter subunit IICB [Gemella sp. GL1]TFU57524.1 PTS mannitol transporter subunit IICB [Gemella sp. WT2a]
MSQKTNNFKVLVQKVGTALSGMVMPNIGAFIAWGLITALFIPKGWIPNESLAKLVGPMIQYLLPLLIAYTAGYNIHKQRGGVVAAIATMGVIVGTEAIMFLGAMVMGPLAAILLKKFDQAVQPKVKTGFEMLVNNFSSGFYGFFLAILGYYAVGPVVKALNDTLAAGVGAIVSSGLIPLANIFIEPAKILFLNNAINHGILTPLGTQAAQESGKSILFLLEANPGVGLGILLAYMLFGKGASKSSAYGASVIHFIGGIHEIYFPYILMKPALIFAAIAGGVSGTATLQFFQAGLVSPASPGSIIAILGMTARDSYFGVIAGVLVAAVVTFVIASIILKTDKNSTGDLAAAQAQMSGMKAESKGQVLADSAEKTISYKQVEKIIFACDAGMGSSAMGASILRDKVKKAGLDLPVSNTAVRNLVDDEKALIITQNELTPRAKEMNKLAIHVSVDNFLSSPRYDEVISKLKDIK